MKNDLHKNNLVNHFRADGKPWKLLHDDKARQMMRSWFLGVKVKILTEKYHLNDYQLHLQLYHHAKRLCQQFFDEVIIVFTEGGSRGLMSKYDIDIKNANRLILKVRKYNTTYHEQEKRKNKEALGARN